MVTSPKRNPELVPIPASRRSNEEMEAIKAKARAFAMHGPPTKGGKRKRMDKVASPPPEKAITETPAFFPTVNASMDMTETPSTILEAKKEPVPLNRKQWKELSSAFRGIPHPYKASGGDAFHVSSQEIFDAMPPNASCVFYVFDRKVNFDAHPKNASFYSLLRSWVQDDPCRIIPDRSNLMDFVSPPASCTRVARKKKGLIRRNVAAQHSATSDRPKADVLAFLSSSREDNSQPHKRSDQEEEGKESRPPEVRVTDLLAEHITNAKNIRKQRCMERVAEINRSLPRLQRLGINISISPRR